MKSNLIKNESATAVVNVVVDDESWKEAQKKGFEKVKSKLKLHGFRDGKSIPDELAKPHINQADVMNESINVILPKVYEAVLTEHKITPIMQPEIKLVKVDENSLELEFTISLYPEVTLGDYKNIDIDLEKVSVSKEEVEEALNKIVKENATLKTSEKPAKLGDTVVFDFVGYINRKPFDGGSAENYSLELGSNQFIPGFEDQLVGVKEGDEKEINVTFPQQYVKELAGKDAIFKCNIHEVKEKILPELNDDFVKSLGMEGVETVEALKTSEEKKIADEKERNAKATQYNKLVDKIVENSKVEISEKTIESEINAMKGDIENRVKQNGLTLEQYLEITNQSEKQLEDSLRADAIKNLKAFVVLAKIAEVENLSVSDKEVDEELEKLGKNYNMSLDQVKKALESQLANFRSNMQNKKIQEFLTANNLGNSSKNEERKKAE